MSRGIKITTSETKRKESYENGKCFDCESENIGNAIICPAYEYVLEGECGDGNSCINCIEDTTPNPDIFLCADCGEGFNFKERCVISRNGTKPKGKQSTLDI